jgi:hypothetical protein
MEQGRILLGEDITKLSIGILWPREHRAHACVGGIKKTYLIARDGMDKRRKESSIRVREVKGEMLDVVTDASESSNPS